MHVSPGSYRRVCCCILFITTALLGCLSGSSLAQQIERSYTTNDSPLVFISNASVVSIVSSKQKEVSVVAEVLAAAIQADEISIKSENNRVDITCHPRRDRKVFLKVRVPANAVLEIKSNGHLVQITELQVREPAEPMVISYASKELIQLSIPEFTALDMTDARNAIERRQLGPLGIGRIGVGGQRAGTGPPFVKVNASRAHVAIVRGTIEPVTRTPTLAATTIARRNSSMSEALRRSSPQLLRPSPRFDQNPPVRPPDTEEGALKLAAYLVNLNVSATDRAGKAVPGLKQDDFSVFEDGVVQQISFFSPERSPFNLVLLIDLSGSVRERIDLIRDTALHFLDVISPQDSVAIVTFTTDVTIISHLTKDRDDLRDRVDFMLPPAGGTAFYDALGYALVEVLRKVKGQRNAVIAITDGEDNSLPSQLVKAVRLAGSGMITTNTGGSFLSFDELLEGAAETDALIYPIHLDPVPTQQSNPSSSPLPPTVPPGNARQAVASDSTVVAREQLQALADVSGGRFYHADRIEDLKDMFQQVAAELRTVYSMAYTPKNLDLDGKFRRVRVQVNRPDIGIRTRPGYFGR
jgi:VWFA-related protein